jgi:hypothetical protein
MKDNNNFIKFSLPEIALWLMLVFVHEIIPPYSIIHFALYFFTYLVSGAKAKEELEQALLFALAISIGGNVFITEIAEKATMQIIVELGAMVISMIIFELSVYNKYSKNVELEHHVENVDKMYRSTGRVSNWLWVISVLPTALFSAMLKAKGIDYWYAAFGPSLILAAAFALASAGMRLEGVKRVQKLQASQSVDIVAVVEPVTADKDS